MIRLTCSPPSCTVFAGIWLPPRTPGSSNPLPCRDRGHGVSVGAAACKGLESEVSFSAGFLSSLSARSLDAGSSLNGSPRAQIVIVVAQRLNHKGGFIVQRSRARCYSIVTGLLEWTSVALQNIAGAGKPIAVSIFAASGVSSSTLMSTLTDYNKGHRV